MSPKMLARSGLGGKKTSRPHLGPSQAIFSMDRTNPKISKNMSIFLGGPKGPIHPVWGHVLASFQIHHSLQATVGKIPACCLKESPGNRCLRVSKKFESPAAVPQTVLALMGFSQECPTIEGEN